MIETSFINPFSFEAKEIVRKLGQIENLDKKNDSLIDIIKHTHSQKLSSIPETLEQLALHKFQWYLDKKTDNFDDIYLILKFMNMMCYPFIFYVKL